MEKDVIQQLYDHYEELDRLKLDASNYLIDIKKAGKDIEHTLERDGKEITLKEAVLWQEVLHLGGDCQAGEILKAKYPTVFEKFNIQNEKSAEIAQFEAINFDIHSRGVRIVDIVKLIEKVLDHRGVKTNKSE